MIRAVATDAPTNDTPLLPMLVSSSTDGDIGTIVLVNAILRGGAYAGFVVKSSVHSVGSYISDLSPLQFKPYEGFVTLSNMK